MLIRRFRASDADALAMLFHASVREGGLRDYSPEQVAAWSPAPPDPERYRLRAADRVFLVAVDDTDRPIGYGDLCADGYVDQLFCRPDRIGTGVGNALCVALEEEACRAGMASMYVNASETARPLFERRGFVVETRNDFAINGVAIHNYRMSKSLA